MRGPWSVPVLANRYRTTPSALTCSRKASAPVVTGMVAFLSTMEVPFQISWSFLTQSVFPNASIEIQFVIDSKDRPTVSRTGRVFNLQFCSAVFSQHQRDLDFSSVIEEKDSTFPPDVKRAAKEVDHERP